MVVIDIPENPNCPAVDLRVFHEVGAPQPVTQVRLEREPGSPAWYRVTGWTTAGTACPAVLQKVDDSGEGVAYLLSGGDAGVRLQAMDAPEGWRLDSPRQWGEAFLLLADLADVRFDGASVGAPRPSWRAQWRIP